MRHVLRTWPAPFQAVLDGLKPYEVRKDDRHFQIGDELVLREYDPVDDRFSGREISGLIVKHKLNGGQFGIQPGFCVLALDTTQIAEGVVADA